MTESGEPVSPAAPIPVFLNSTLVKFKDSDSGGPIAAAADAVAADHGVFQVEGQVDLQLALVGLAEVDLDLLAFALIGLVEQLGGGRRRWPW